MASWDDCCQLATSLASAPHQIQRQLELDISKFTVSDLKIIIKHFRTKFAVSRNHSPNSLNLHGKKAQLVQSVEHALRHNSPSSTSSQHQQGQNRHRSSSSNQARSQHQRQQQQQQHQRQQQQQQRQQLQRQQLQRQQQQQHQQIVNVGRHLRADEVEQLCKHAKFMEKRSPFFVVNTVLDQVSVIVSRKSRLSFVLNSEVLNALRRKNRSQQIHLRLFSANPFSPFGWNQVRISVKVNDTFVPIDSRVTNTGIKKKGIQIIRPLDITTQVVTFIQPNLYSLPIRVDLSCETPFNGIAVAEIVRIRSTQEVVNDVVTPDVESRLGTNRTKPPKVCEFCGAQNDLLRCSRCKNTWYCGQNHQSQHWELHSLVCKPPRIASLVKAVVPSMNENEDEILVVDSRVCLRCPLSVGRIKIASKGSKCSHPQCFDLATFLEFCHMTGIWQCPICTNRLPFSELEIDVVMNKILLEVPEEIYQVRLLPNGEYAVVSLEEEKEKENETAQAKPKKRRKLTNNSHRNGFSSNSVSHNDSSHSNESQSVLPNNSEISSSSNDPEGTSLNCAIVLD
uniref:SUMO/Smt3 ligase n=1 Tax=Hirondellea gigas TaxID=1518452 RepID=A0A6A7G806_9CRUS